MLLLCVSNLLAVESFGRVKRLDKCRCVADEECIADGTGQHADHRQPDVRQTLWRVPAITNAQHV